MRNNTTLKIFGLTLLLTLSSACSSIVTNEIKADTEKVTKQTANIHSSIISFEDTYQTPYKSSVFHTYFYGETVGTTDTIVGLAIIEPNNEIHPPHKHAEEEYLYIVEGSGIWTLNGIETPAKTGDVLYVSPWDMHGIFNTGKIPMKFFITRSSSKGVMVVKP